MFYKFDASLSSKTLRTTYYVVWSAASNENQGKSLKKNKRIFRMIYNVAKSLEEIFQFCRSWNIPSWFSNPIGKLKLIDQWSLSLSKKKLKNLMVFIFFIRLFQHYFFEDERRFYIIFFSFWLKSLNLVSWAWYTCI